MGITNFYKWVKETYSDSIRSYWLSSYDHVYIDLNYALHYVAHDSNEDNIYNKLNDFIVNILYKTSPKKSLVLATDGVPPIAKLALQRKRRNINNCKSDNLSIQFTFGTKFMENLANDMDKYFEDIRKKYNIEIKLYFGEYNEAEIKIRECISKRFIKYQNDTHIIVSSDADVIVILMGVIDISYLSKIFILTKQNGTISITYLASLLSNHIDNVGCSINPHLDFIACSLFLGNDYIPKVGYLDIEKLWLSYKDVIKNDKRGLIINQKSDIINKNNINIDFLTKLLYRINCNNKINTFKLNNEIKYYNNYYEGYLWCLDMYINGKCRRYDYICHNTKLPNPFGMMIALLSFDNILYVKNNTKFCMDKILYTILVLPKNNLSITDKNMDKYKKFIKNNPNIYKNDITENELFVIINNFKIYKK